ncbi:DUF4274 domain-containing protein [Qipengyuania gelatinilytica]|uniref:DUF4274 domain-containing protein n=1 Tax=Qipengyuania gelatinilytica TaxID=2867231 RepID=A0ABX9A6V1_9SPHN|nr:DUF4274 domain-containing protein [Qipengyuania gelatinilytica]QZD95999.1 DUF4274 domain-containing protein [Qipengyuania gelatinilytica]
MTDDECIKKLLAAQIACLSKMNPDDWHFIAEVHNWDDELDVLYWIVSQPECDKATARSVFWKGEPTGYDFEESEEVMGESSYSVEPMLKFIADRFRNQGYRREEIKFDIHEAITGDRCYVIRDDRSDIDYGMDREFEELRNGAKKAGAPSFPNELMVTHTPGRRINQFAYEFQSSEPYPWTIDLETGELIYEI